MASVQELILAAQASQPKSPLTSLAEMITAGSEGYFKGVKQKRENALAESELSESELQINKLQNSKLNFVKSWNKHLPFKLNLVFVKAWMEQK
jgi:hypothetical protein